MTGRELILYILENNLENEKVFNNGRFLGFLTAAEFAAKKDVGEETVRLWVNLGYIDGVIIYDELYIPCNAKIKEPKQEAKTDERCKIISDVLYLGNYGRSLFNKWSRYFIKIRERIK